MADTITSVTEFLTKPPARFLAGCALFAIVVKFFSSVEGVLSDDSKLEIAVWLLDLKTAKKIQSWPTTFAKIFDRVFGERHLSWRCFWGSSIASYCSLLIIVLMASRELRDLVGKLPQPRGPQFWPLFLMNSIFGNILPDYVSLLKARYLIGLMGKTNGMLARTSLFVLEIVLTCTIGFVGALLGTTIHWGLSLLSSEMGWNARVTMFRHMLPAIPKTVATVVMSKGGLTYGVAVLFFYPAFFVSWWVTSYYIAGMLIIAARRFDIGLGWLTAKVDIEHKPLSAIGYAAGAIVALIWWTATL